MRVSRYLSFVSGPAAGQRTVRGAGQERLKGLAQRAWPWLLFAAILAWRWRNTDLLHSVTGYGDVLEGAWAVTWLNTALRHGLNPLWYPLAYHPTGYQTVTYAWGPANFLVLLPLYWLGGAALALNVSTLLSFVLAFAGMYALGLRYLPRLAATVAALLFTFWGFRWYSITGQLNISLGSALLPWLLWSLERGYAAPLRRSWPWYLLGGVIWGISANCSLYFIWIDAVAFAGWLLGRLFARHSDRGSLLRAALIVTPVAALLSLPFVIVFWRASETIGAPFFSIYEVNQLGASLNSLPLPYLEHPWLGPFIARLTQGRLSGEANSANLGTLACLLALFGLAGTWRRVAWRPLLFLGGLGLVLALGLTLHWNDQTVQTAFFAPAVRLIWSAGHLLKPGLFVGTTPPDPFTNALPLPALVLSALVPAFERARVFSRYAFFAGIAVYLLAGFTLTRVRPQWLSVLLAALLIAEVLPPPTAAWPFPPAPHPAFAWLRQQPGSPAGLVQLSTTDGYRLELPHGGSSIYAVLYHGQAAVSGASAMMPGPTNFLAQWLASHAHPLAGDELMSLLGFYKLRYLALELHGGWDDQALAEAKANKRLRYVNCFPGDELPWDSTICLFEFLPADQLATNVLFGDGWSGAEAWGHWIDGTRAQATWVADTRQPYRVHLQAFPMCVPGHVQEVKLEANGVLLGSHEWTGCDQAEADFLVPPRAVNVGANELTLQARYSARPVDVTGGANPDPRALSLGVTGLRVDSAAQ